MNVEPTKCINIDSRMKSRNVAQRRLQNPTCGNRTISLGEINGGAGGTMATASVLNPPGSEATVPGVGAQAGGVEASGCADAYAGACSRRKEPKAAKSTAPMPTRV